MTAQTSDALPNAIDSERLLAEYRETIIKLEAHGSPEERAALWDVLGTMLADMKRQQALIQPPSTLRSIADQSAPGRIASDRTEREAPPAGGRSPGGASTVLRRWRCATQSHIRTRHGQKNIEPAERLHDGCGLFRGDIIGRHLRPPDALA